MRLNFSSLRQIRNLDDLVKNEFCFINIWRSWIIHFSTKNFLCFPSKKLIFYSNSITLPSKQVKEKKLWLLGKKNIKSIIIKPEKQNMKWISKTAKRKNHLLHMPTLFFIHVHCLPFFFKNKFSWISFFLFLFPALMWSISTPKTVLVAYKVIPICFDSFSSFFTLNSTQWERFFERGNLNVWAVWDMLTWKLFL